MLVSLLTRDRKNWHSAWPMVWPPESTVRSRADRPLALNMEMRVERSEDGEGISVLAFLWLAVLASLRPSGTCHVGPPSRFIPSLVASARISAHETVLLQEASTLVLMVSITSKPLAEFLFGAAFFSPTKVVPMSSNKIDPSQPFTKQSWKNRRRIEAPILASFLIVWTIALRTMV
uniref:Uncharacterized protein n=1 Tax=Lotus japonicus TaxID=34305 RepID=I3S266_LOTJA|nr:unknown [Lotus japonicus]